MSSKVLHQPSNLKFVDFTSMGDVEKINNTLDGWEPDTEEIRKDYSKQNSALLLFKIAKIAGQAVGYVILREDYDNENSTYIPFIAVKTSEQRKGIGTSLMRQAVDKTKALGKKILTLYCEEKNIIFYAQIASKFDIDILALATGDEYSNGQPLYFVRYDIDKK